MDVYIGGYPNPLSDLDIDYTPLNFSYFFSFQGPSSQGALLNSHRGITHRYHKYDKYHTYHKNNKYDKYHKCHIYNKKGLAINIINTINIIFISFIINIMTIKKVQIPFPVEVHGALRRKAFEEGTTMTALIIEACSALGGSEIQTKTVPKEVVDSIIAPTEPDTFYTGESIKTDLSVLEQKMADGIELTDAEFSQLTNEREIAEKKLREASPEFIAEKALADKRKKEHEERLKKAEALDKAVEKRGDAKMNKTKNEESE